MRVRTVLFCCLVAVSSTWVVEIEGQSASPAALATRVQTLEDRDAIRALLVAYATTLDNRDFAGFEQLWAKDAEFFGGTGNTAKGPAAIRDLLRGLLGKNGAPTPGRDFHLVMNQTVDVRGDTATGFSRGTWVTTNAESRLQVTIIANYYDQFIREDGRWKFKRHQIGGAPPGSSSTAPHPSAQGAATPAPGSSGPTRPPLLLSESWKARTIPLDDHGAGPASQDGVASPTFHQVRAVVRLADGTWLVGDRATGPSADFNETDVSIADLRWIKLDPTRVVTVGTFLDRVDLSKVDEVGFADLMPGSGHGPGGYVNVARFEVYGKPVKR